MEPMVHISRGGKVVASHRLSAMRMLIDGDAVRPSDFYWMRGMAEWRRVDQGRFSSFLPLPAPPPSVPRAPSPKSSGVRSENASRSTPMPAATWAVIIGFAVLSVLAIGYVAFTSSARDPAREKFSFDLPRPLAAEYPSIRRQATNGDINAYVRLGMCELWGIGVSESSSAAFASFQVAADKGHPLGQYWLGEAYLAGWGTSKDLVAGFSWIKKSAEQGMPFARYRLGTLYYGGLGTAKSLSESLRWLRLAADDGVPIAQAALGVALRQGEGLKKNPTEAFQYLKKAADADVVFAQFNVAQMYSVGEGVAVDAKEALRYMRKAAEKEDLDAIYAMGLCYVGETKGFVATDVTIGVGYFRKSADKGHAESQFKLGYHYYFGEGVEKSEIKAFNYYLKAAKQGHAEAQAIIGIFYRDGITVAKSPKLAFKYFYESGMQEDPLGAFNLGLCYANGIGVDKQPDQAAIFYRIACAGGYAEAYAEYARLQFNGIGIVQDKTLAYAYGLVALAKGVESAKLWANLDPADPTVASINQEQGKALAKRILAAMDAGKSIPTISVEREAHEPAGGGSSGSGMVFTADGHCFTNHHVVAGGTRFFVVPAGSTKQLVADVIVVDEANDLAILKIRGWSVPEGAPSHPPPIIDSRSANAGDRVFTFGYPVPDILSDAVKYTSGDINALSGMHGDQNRMQVSMPIHGGNSGGPVALEDGRIVGIVVSTANPEYFFKTSKNIPQNINFAVKADYLRILAQNNGIRLPAGSVSGDPKQHVRAYSVQVIAEK